MMGCWFYKEWKIMKYTNGLDSITHEAIEDFEDQQG
jgi:hypothetical protein